MTINSDTTLRELAFIVCTALNRNGTTAVLSGGGAATIYAPEAYQSRDLDFVLSYWSSFGGESDRPLRDLGFEARGGTYRHQDTIFTVEFPAGPLAVGDELIDSWATLTDQDYLLHIITPTDSVRDRLAWFLFNNDYAGLDQALSVARSQPVDLDRIEEWCKREGREDKFAVFSHRLQGG